MNYKKVIISICISWTAFVLGMVAFNESVLNSNQEVLLKTVPVDPRDLLRGDYVVLAYEIGQHEFLKNFDNNTQVFVTLKTDTNNIAQIDKIADYKPNNNELYIKGKVLPCDTTIPLFKNGTCVKYGIESYFVKEGEGKQLEKSLRDGALVKVSIDRQGHAKVKGFME